MELYFIRHGQSEANVDPRVYTLKKDQDIELTDVGRAQAEAVGKELNKKFEYNRADFFISPYKRVVDTFDIIRAQARDYSIFSTQSPLLREQEHPIYTSQEEMDVLKRERAAFSQFYYRYPNAESQADVYLRVQTFLNDLEIRRIKHEVSPTVVIVAHEVVIRMFLMILDNLLPENANMSILNCEIIKRYL
jgi:broad specificity phosphatase PhoE